MDLQGRLKEQYKTDKNLNIRIGIHKRYSTNPLGFNNWIFNQYQFGEQDSILDLGCGTSVMWRDNFKKLPKAYQLTLTDYSEGMVAVSQKTFEAESNITCQVANVLNLPFPDKSFDKITANMVLFHLPDLDKGLSEIRRVLKPGGVFYATTFGENGISQTLGKWISAIGKTNETPDVFTLQNGQISLSKYFEMVEKIIYEDGLEVTEIEDIIDYMYSLPEVFELEPTQRDAVRTVLEEHVKDGILSIPKEYGMFICR